MGECCILCGRRTLSNYCSYCDNCSNKLVRKREKEHDLDSIKYLNARNKRLKNNFDFIRKRRVRARKYFAIRYYSDENYNLAIRLRNRIRNVIKKYYKTGKMPRSKKLGINYKAIIKHLGPQPKNKTLKWSIDHIRPLSKFNLIKKKEIKKACAPKNHQWLPLIKNIKKYNHFRVVKRI